MSRSLIKKRNDGGPFCGVDTRKPELKLEHLYTLKIADTLRRTKKAQIIDSLRARYEKNGEAIGEDYAAWFKGDLKQRPLCTDSDLSSSCR